MEPAEVQPLERFRDYLHLLTRMHLDGRLGGKLDPSDIVQQSLLEAHAKKEQFRGQTDAELAQWLGQILAHNLADAIRALHRVKRDVARERSLDAALEESSCRLQAWLAAEQSSPSEQAIRNEQLLHLAQALAQLPEPQREVVTLHHLQRWSLADLAAHLGRSEPAVAGLLHRGLKRLRDIMHDPE